MSQITKKEYLDNFQVMIATELKENAKALPDGFNRQRFILNCIALLNDNFKNFDNIDLNSMISAFAKGAYLGLDFFNRECYAIPYNGMVKFQTDYKGEIKLAKKYSKNPIKDIYAKNVKEGDFFEEIIIDGKQSINFKPISFSKNPIIGTFAVAVFKDGSMMYDTMSVLEMEHIKKIFSNTQNSKAWKETPGEMYKKTVLRRLCKLIDLDFDNIEQIKAFQEGADFNIKKDMYIDNFQSEVNNPFTEKEEIQDETNK